MKMQRVAIALTVANLALFLFVIAQTHPLFASNDSILRGRGLEIVDDHGRVRAEIRVFAPTKESPHETVLLRLATERGRPSVKIGASEQVSGLSFAGPTGTQRTWVIMQSKDGASWMQLSNEDGRQLTVKP